jgi:uncharacterized protein (TIGR03067 family)
MRLVKLGLPLLAVLSLAPAPVPPYRPKPDTRKEDLKMMQGTWEVTLRTVGSEGRPVNPDRRMTGILSNERLQFWQGGEKVLESSITLGTEKRAKTVDIKRLSGGKAKVAGVLKAVYKFEGGSFVIRYHSGKPYDERPEGFEKDGPDYLEMVFKRKKP